MVKLRVRGAKGIRLSVFHGLRLIGDDSQMPSALLVAAGTVPGWPKRRLGGMSVGFLRVFGYAKDAGGGRVAWPPSAAGKQPGRGFSG